MLNFSQWFTARISVAAALAIGFSLVLLEVPSAEAAETVILRYGIFRGSIPMADLTEFAETGETTRRLRRYFNRANQDPEKFRQFLTEEVATDPRTLNRVLESPAGDVLLDEMTQYIHSPERRDDRATLKSALTLAANNDNHLSFVELLEEYPTEEVHINVRRVAATYRQFAAIQERVGGVLEGDLGEILREVNPF